MKTIKRVNLKNKNKILDLITLTYEMAILNYF